MVSNKTTNILRWIARIYGGIVILIPLIALAQVAMGGRNFVTDWQNYLLYISLIVGLLIAYKWELIGGLLTTIGILISGFVHPLILAPGILFIICGVLHWNKKRE